MTVAYAPPLTGAPAEYGQSLTHEAVTSGPAYIRTRTMTRWHRIRWSYLRLNHDGGITQVWSFWCGQTTFSRRNPLTADEPVAGEPRCGTCEGRAIGANPERPEWLFTPWTLERPDLCPGSRTRFADPRPGTRVTECFTCGSIEPVRACGGPWTPTWQLAAHPPGPGLVEPCDFHGWRGLMRVREQTVCRCRVIPRSE